MKIINNELIKLLKNLKNNDSSNMYDYPYPSHTEQGLVTLCIFILVNPPNKIHINSKSSDVPTIIRVIYLAAVAYVGHRDAAILYIPSRKYSQKTRKPENANAFRYIIAPKNFKISKKFLENCKHNRKFTKKEISLPVLSQSVEVVTFSKKVFIFAYKSQKKFVTFQRIYALLPLMRPTLIYEKSKTM